MFDKKNNNRVSFCQIETANYYGTFLFLALHSKWPMEKLKNYVVSELDVSKKKYTMWKYMPRGKQLISNKSIQNTLRAIYWFLESVEFFEGWTNVQSGCLRPLISLSIQSIKYKIEIFNLQRNAYVLICTLTAFLYKRRNNHSKKYLSWFERINAKYVATSSG